MDEPASYAAGHHLLFSRVAHIVKSRSRTDVRIPLASLTQASSLLARFAPSFTVLSSVRLSSCPADKTMTTTQQSKTKQNKTRNKKKNKQTKKKQSDWISLTRSVLQGDFIECTKTV